MVPKKATRKVESAACSDAGTALPIRAEGEATLLGVRLTPRGGRDDLDGIASLSDGRAVLLARVRAVPEDGAANAALLTLLRRTFDLPAGALTLASGATSRLKTIRIMAPYEDVKQRLETLPGIFRPADA